ncbi:MAG: hypothetical protein ACX94A_09730, partial [Algiphilus sp.]
MGYRNAVRYLTVAAVGAALLPAGAYAKVSAEEAAKLGNELSQVGANPKGNAEGTIPELTGEANFGDEQKNLTPEELEAIRERIVQFAEDNPELNLITNL